MEPIAEHDTHGIPNFRSNRIVSVDVILSQNVREIISEKSRGLVHNLQNIDLVSGILYQKRDAIHSLLDIT